MNSLAYLVIQTTVWDKVVYKFTRSPTVPKSRHAIVHSYRYRRFDYFTLLFKGY